MLEQLVEWKLSNVLNVAMFHAGELLRSIEDKNTVLGAFLSKKFNKLKNSFVKLENKLKNS